MSKEISQILHAWNRLDHSRFRAALATVVQVEGSAYRRPGARMLVTDDGRLTGAISGGCLEGDALRKALLVIHKGAAAVVTYDTTDEDDASFGVGLGCNGVIHVLLEPLDPSSPQNPLALLHFLQGNDRCGVLVTLFSLQRDHLPGGTCYAVTEDGAASGHFPETARQYLAPAVRRVLEDGESAFIPAVGDPPFQAFVEWVEPPVSVVIAGAGNDVVPLTELARTMGWKITVVDGRASHALPERFPAAGAVRVIKKEDLDDLAQFDRRACFVLMTHNYTYDLTALAVLLKLGVSYIGVLGPKKKMRRMLDELGLETLPDHVYGPVGLDIGAESPEEIALSIVAEIRAVLSGKEVHSLRKLPETIHPRNLKVAGER